MRFPIRYMVGGGAASSLVLSTLLAGHQMIGATGDVLRAAAHGPPVGLASSSLSSQQATLGEVQQSVSNVAGQAQAQQAQQLQQLLKDEQFAAAMSRATTTTTTTSAPASHSTAPALPTGGGAGGQALAEAEAQIGKPYQYAGAGPDSFDCSGLTMFAWRAAGVSLPHSAQDQYDQVQHISMSELQPGDLLFWGSSTSDIYHVAMYVSPGQMIEAENEGIPVGIHPIRTSGLVAEGRPS